MRCLLIDTCYGMECNGSLHRLPSHSMPHQPDLTSFYNSFPFLFSCSIFSTALHIQCHSNLKQAAMGDAPVLPALASKPAHVGIHILQEETPGCTPHTCARALCKQLDEGHNVGGVDCVGLFHNGGCTWVHLNHLQPPFIPYSLLPESLSAVTHDG